MQTLLFIESNTSGTGRLFARTARAHGLHPLMICADASRYPYLAEDGVEHVRMDVADGTGLPALCRSLAVERAVAGVTSSSEYWVGTAAAIARELGLPAPPAEAIARCRNKLSQRRRLAEAGIGQPRFAPASDTAEAVAAAAALGWPVVVKPVAGSGSVGVRLCRDTSEVAAHAGALFDAAPAGATGAQVLVESFVDAPEFSVETLAGAVIGITRKHVSPPPLFVETGHDFPAALAPADAGRVAAAAVRTLAALDLRWGAAHIELRLTPAGPVVIEVNPRLAGGFIPELVRLATGIDLIDAAIRLATGRPASLAPSAQRHAAIRFVLPRAAGRLVDVTGAAAARSVAGVCDVAIYRRAGEALTLSGDFRDRAGHVIACGDSEDMAAAAAERGRAALGLTIAGDGP